MIAAAHGVSLDAPAPVTAAAAESAFQIVYGVGAVSVERSYALFGVLS